MVNGNGTGSEEGDWDATRLQFVLYGLVLPGICFPGMLANIASFVVFTRPKMRNSVNTYLAGLSVFDFFLLLMSLFLYPPLAYAQEFKSVIFYRIFNFTVFVAYPFSLVVQFASVYTCVAIALDRFMAVRYPLRIRDLSTPRRAHIVLASIVVAAFCFRLPTLFEIRLDANMTVRPTELRKDPRYQLIYTTLLYIIIMYLIPFVTLTILNCFLARSLHQAYKARSCLANRGKVEMQRSDWEKERKCNMTALLIIFSFLVLNAPAFVSSVLEGALPKKMMLHVAVRSFVFLGNVLVCLNSAINFIIYCAFGLKFRYMFVKIFLPCLVSRLNYSGVNSSLATNTLTQKSKIHKSSRGTWVGCGPTTQLLPESPLPPRRVSAESLRRSRSYTTRPVPQFPVSPEGQSPTSVASVPSVRPELILDMD